MIYLLDTNVIADALNANLSVISYLRQHQQSDILLLCSPVEYEIQRGFLWRGASNKLTIYQQELKPLFAWIDLIASDWQVAAQLWASARQSGKQLSDVDFLLAAITQRLDAILVSADADFDALAIQQINWRLNPPSL